MCYTYEVAAFCVSVSNTAGCFFDPFAEIKSIPYPKIIILINKGEKYE